ncbi:MAG: cation transporter [Armatimonadetes bacterium]|nr:cation transporter [Armatimonadota bacterium]
MKKLSMVAAVGMLSLSAALAQHEGHGGHGMGTHGAPAQATTVVFRVAALHCQACVNVVQPALAKTAGVKSAKASFQEKTVVVTYEEGKTDVQALAQVIARTPSPMPKARFEPALLLMAHGVSDAKQAGRLSKALKGVKGVGRADVQSGVASVTFAGKPAVRLADLKAAAAKAGFMVMPLPAERAKPAGAHGQGHGAESGGHAGHQGHGH